MATRSAPTPPAPYFFTYTPPANGTFVLQARATDNEGAVGTSGTRTITVANQPPVITAAALTPPDQGFSDAPLTVTGLTASDPEGTDVFIAYQWQSSTDGLNFTTATGLTTAAIDRDPGSHLALRRHPERRHRTPALRSPRPPR